MKHLLKLKLALVILSFSATSAMASEYMHLIDGSLDLANTKRDVDSGGVVTDNNFKLIVKYRNQIKPSWYLVTGFSFIDFEAENSFGFDIGVEKNLFGNNDQLEIGPGATLNFSDGEYVGDGDYKSYGLLPYLFIRSFISGSRAYVMYTLGYKFYFADRNGIDENITGITMSFGFGLGF